MKNVYAYIRVSDKKQEDGASLSEQKRQIKEYAQKNQLSIVRWFEEVQTAAKKGRPIFSQMLALLKEHQAEGVIIHKIDRSARNLHDWATIGDLIDHDISVYFAHESIDLNQRSGRLSADIQAVIASDYIRNLRQEAIKGLYGRLKQGIYPFHAPLGYLNQGKGKVKTMNPLNSHLIVALFQLYSTEAYSIDSLVEEMYVRGLRNKNGKKVSKNSIIAILKNPFYIGLMKIKGQTFVGKHKPLIDQSTFKKVQLILIGKKRNRSLKHHYQFRKMLRCKECNYYLVAEKQKGRVYYRCQTKQCPTKTLREDYIERYIENLFTTFTLYKSEYHYLHQLLLQSEQEGIRIQNQKQVQYKMELSKLKSKSQRLLEAYLENLLDKEEYFIQKEELHFQIQEVKGKMEVITTSKGAIFTEIHNILELCKSPYKIYQKSNPKEKRELLKNLSSNFEVKGKSLSFSMRSPYLELANRYILLSGAPEQDTNRILTSQITYTDKNTSGIRPKAMSKIQMKGFFEFLLNIIQPLSNYSNHKTKHELPQDHTST